MKNRHSESHSLLMDVKKFFRYFPILLSELCEIRLKKSSRSAAGNFRENRRVEDHTILMGVTAITLSLVL